MAVQKGRFDHAEIEELADAIAELLQNPITIEDADHRLIAHSTHGDSTDQARWSTILGRRVPDQVLSRLWKDGVFQQLWTKEAPVYVEAKDEIGLGKRMAIAIRKGHDILGYIWAQEVNRPFSREDEEVLQEAARAAVTKLIQRQGKRKQEERRHKDFFWELLLGNYGREKEIVQKAASLQLRLVQPYLICVLETAIPRVEQAISPLLMQHKALWVSDGSQLIIMLGMPGADEKAIFTYADQFLADSISKLRERFQGKRVTAAYGNCYDSFIYVERSYQEALQVLQMKQSFPQETQQMNGFHQLGIYRFLPDLKKWAEATGYQNEYLNRLRRYDTEHQADLLETLETYLDAVGKVSLAAKRLHIHNNTLSYRLRRIEEVMGVSLDDANVRTSLYLDIKLAKLNHET